MNRMADGGQSRRLFRYDGPYETWSFGAALGRAFSFPALAEDAAQHYAALVEGGAEPAALKAQPPVVLRLPPLWNPGAKSLAAIPFAMSRPDERGRYRDLREQDFDRLRLAASAAGEGAAPRYRVNYPISAQSWVTDYDPSRAMESWQRPATRPRVIIGVIDDGIPFLHRGFVENDGRSRISHCWLQPAAAPTGPAAVPFGREWTNARIDALRASGTDEMRLYREAGAIDARLPELGLHLRRRATHGAHIAGLCGADDPVLRAAPLGDEVQIVVVQLPNTIAWDTSGFGKEMYMLSALHYVFDRARRIAAAFPGGPEELPLIVNFSYGWSANRHDGGATMERAMEQLISRRRAMQPLSSLNMPMGNNFAKSMHASIGPADMTGGEARIGWQVFPDDRTSSYLEIWFPEGQGGPGSGVRLTPPPGTTLDSPAEISLDGEEAPEGGDVFHHMPLRIGGKVVGMLSADLHLGERWRVTLALIPTVDSRGEGRRAPSGLWKIALRGPGLGHDERIGVWLQRDDDPEALRSFGRQSRLVNPDVSGANPGPLEPALPSGKVRGYGTFNGIGSAPSVTRVSGYVMGSDAPSLYSGAAALTFTDGALKVIGVRPAFAAPADRGLHRAGLQSIGVLSGSAAQLQGTSAACALATRWMALNIAAGHDIHAGLRCFFRGDDHGRDPAPALRSGETDRSDSDAIRAARLGDGLIPFPHP
ncbi:hypothetical protein [Paracoccus sediminicola]|uniref:hypothetical protein n=1 Tax=Paracoccus sediminicola TaxID=3017783 RepID=UPI0022F13021|nr:hypothetical protein [Paracoccus sediminicola]WBU57262.1 hypothetical protein PAF18_02100 [Paracoccus sediminicola]